MQVNNMTWEDIIKRMTLADILDREMKHGYIKFGRLFNTYKRLCKAGKEHVRKTLTDSADNDTLESAVAFGLDARGYDELGGGFGEAKRQGLDPQLIKKLGLKLRKAIGEGARKCADSKKPKTPEVEPSKYSTREEFEELERRVKLGLEDPSVLDL